MMSVCIDNASKMADMVLHALRTTGNISVNLSLNIFDKQISPVVLYGSATCATPKSFNVYLDNQDEGVMPDWKHPVYYMISYMNMYPLNMPAVLANWVLEQKGGYLSVWNITPIRKMYFANPLILGIFATLGKTKIIYQRNYIWIMRSAHYISVNMPATWQYKEN